MKTISLFLVASGLFTAISPVAAQNTAFTYQGQVDYNGAPANGTYNLTFSLFAGGGGGTAVAGPVTNSAVAVSNGLFTATIDFGAAVWNGSAYWLEVGIATNGSASFTTLSPRQQMTPVPYAIAAGNVAGTLNGSSITLGTITAAQIASNQIVTSLNNLQNAVTLAAGANVSVSNAAGNKIVISASGGGGGTGGDWLLTGNANTTSGESFLGTTDNETLEFRVQNTRGFLLEPGFIGAFGPAVPNVVGGSANNSTAGSDLVQGAAIGGGDSNTVAQRFGTIGGGQGNYISGVSPYATIGGGMNNSNSGAWATIGGGISNQSVGTYSEVGGGRFNKIISSSGCMIGGGEFNLIDDGSSDSIITGGAQNYIGTGVDDSIISGGFTNTIGASGISCTIGGGLANTITERCWYSTIGGGYSNIVDESTSLSFVMQSTIAGGFQNFITDSDSASISGGFGNVIDTGDLATIGGGKDNTVSASSATVGGGSANTISNGSVSSVISGGVQNSIGGDSLYASILGGQGNAIGSNATAATVAGGQNNVAIGKNSFAAGLRAQALNDNTFVWSDGSLGAGSGFSSSQSGQFLILAHNGVGINTTTIDPEITLDVAGAIQAYGILANNGNFSNAVLCSSVTCSNLAASVSVTAPNLVYASDRNLKENFLPVAADDILAKVAALPISRWNFKKDKTADHIGPVAQDFHEAFGLDGDDDKHISVVDEGGVALAAIQGLNQKVDVDAARLNERIAMQSARLRERDDEILDLKTRLEKLEQLLGKPLAAAAAK